MKLAEKEAMVALGEREVPVGCVVVRNGEVIARGHNRTNFELDPTRHAELVAIDALLAEQHEVVNPHPTLCSLAIDISLITRERAIQLGVHSARSAPVRAPLQWCLSGPQQQGSNTRALLDDCTLYVTCEPCIMCATALSMLGLSVPLLPWSPPSVACPGRGERHPVSRPARAPQETHRVGLRERQVWRQRIGHGA